MQNNLTPLSTTFFIFALCTSYIFISMNNAEFSYIADYKFILFKIVIIISTIALGFLTTVFSCSIYAIDIPMVRQIITNYDFTTNHIVQTFLLYISSVWMALVMALLPFGHTVFNRTTGAVDSDKTQQLMVVQQTVYSGPYYIFMILMGVFLFIFFVVVGHTYNVTPWLANLENPGTSEGIVRTLKAGARAQATFGFYFRLSPEDLQQLQSAQ